MSKKNKRIQPAIESPLGIPVLPIKNMALSSSPLDAPFDRKSGFHRGSRGGDGYRGKEYPGVRSKVGGGERAIRSRSLPGRNLKATIKKVSRICAR